MNVVCLNFLIGSFKNLVKSPDDTQFYIILGIISGLTIANQISFSDSNSLRDLALAIVHDEISDSDRAFANSYLNIIL